MATPAPTTPGSPPTLPTSTDAESTFDTLWDAFNTWLANNLWPYLGAVAGSTAANATEAEAAALTATTQAAYAIAAAGAALWVSGTNYAAGVAVYSPSNGATYRTLTAGPSTTDPALDPVRWRALVGGAPAPDYLLINAGVI